MDVAGQAPEDVLYEAGKQHFRQRDYESALIDFKLCRDQVLKRGPGGHHTSSSPKHARRTSIVSTLMDVAMSLSSQQQPVPAESNFRHLDGYINICRVQVDRAIAFRELDRSRKESGHPEDVSPEDALYESGKRLFRDREWALALSDFEMCRAQLAHESVDEVTKQRLDERRLDRRGSNTFELTSAAMELIEISAGPDFEAANSLRSSSLLDPATIDLSSPTSRYRHLDQYIIICKAQLQLSHSTVKAGSRSSIFGADSSTPHDGTGSAPPPLSFQFTPPLSPLGTRRPSAPPPLSPFSSRRPSATRVSDDAPLPIVSHFGQPLSPWTSRRPSLATSTASSLSTQPEREALIFVCSPSVQPLPKAKDEAIALANHVSAIIRIGGTAEELQRLLTEGR